MSRLEAGPRPQPAARAARGGSAPRGGRRPIDRPARWKLLLRRQRRMLRPLLVLLVLGAAGIGALGLERGVGRGRNPREDFGRATAQLGLRVRQVLVEGRRKTPDALLRAALGVSLGDPVLTFSLGGARERIESIHWVQSASVERRLPDTILVRLVERHPFAVWQHDGRYVLIDRAGNLVTDSDVAAFAAELPLVVGAGAPQAAGTLIDALAAQPSLQPRLVAAVRVGGRRWNLRMRNGMDVLLPEAALPQALAKLVQLEADHKVLDRPIAAIDLRLPDRLVIRLAQDHGADAGHPGRNGASSPGSLPELLPASSPRGGPA